MGLVGAPLVGTAYAGNCTILHSGSTVSDTYCNTNAGTGTDVCQVSGTTITCDLNRLTTAVGTQSYSTLQGSNFEFMGYSSPTNEFCCIIPATGVTRVDVLGTAYGDWAYLNDGSTAVNLQPYDTNLTAVLALRAGNDTGDGSDYNTGGYTYIEELRGDDDNDVMRGNNGADYIFGNDGADYLHGNFGDDNIFGGAGADFIYGNEDYDNIGGGSGADTITGDTGDDTINGNEDADTIYGGDGADDIEGEDGDDILYGDATGDIIAGGAGNDTIYGGDGSDTINGNSGVDTIVAGTGDDLVHGDSDGDLISGGLGEDSLYGDEGSDTMCGDEEPSYSLRDKLYGGNGDDTMWGPAADCSVGYYNQGSGDAGTDACDNCSSPGYSPACEVGISTRPSGCP